MGSSVNKVFVLGNVTRDVEVRYTPSGIAVATMSIATNRKWKDKNGDMQEDTEFHRVVAYQRLAEIAGEYLAKGKPVHIEGYLKTRKWEKEGVTMYTTEIVVEQLSLLSYRDSGDAPSPEQRENRAAARRAAAPKSQTAFDDMEDDIPF